MPAIDIFKGTGSGKEQAQNWLHKLKANKFTTITSDANHIFIFKNHLEADSHTNQRFNAIPPADHTKCVNVESKFTARWPVAKKPTPTQDKLHAKFTNIVLDDTDMGKKVGTGKEEDQEWSHIDWVLRARAATEDISDPSGNMIPQAKANMPYTIHSLLPTGTDKDWDTFIEVVSLIKISKLFDVIEDCCNIQDLKSI